MPETPLGDLIQAVKSPRAGTRSLPLLSMTMHDGLVDQSSKFKKRIASQDISDYKIVSYGQLVVGFPIDEGVLDFQRLYAEGVVSPAYGVWDLSDPAQVSSDYLRRYLRSPRAITYYKAKLRGSTARRRSLPREDFLALPVPLPPLPEQRRIAAILDHADALRAKRRQVLTHLQTLRQSIYHDIFGSPREWPDRWPMGTLGELAVSVTYGTSGKAGKTGDWPILRMGNITDFGDVDLSDLKYIDLDPGDVAKYTVRRGDMLFNRTNSKEKVGKTAVVRTDEPLAVAGYLVRVRFEDSATAEFVSSYLTTNHGKAVRRRMAKSAVNQANINATEMRGIKIAHPPSELKRSFESALVEIESLRSRIQKALAVDQALFISLESRAFRGEL